MSLVKKKNRLQNLTLKLEMIGFLLAIATCWITETLDPPFNLGQVIIETVVVATLGATVLWVTNKLLDEIDYLEGFIVICASCKKVREGEEWVPIEKLILANSDIDLSHGLCPDCKENLYGQYLRDKKTEKAPPAD